MDFIFKNVFFDNEFYFSTFFPFILRSPTLEPVSIRNTLPKSSFPSPTAATLWLSEVQAISLTTPGRYFSYTYLAICSFPIASQI